MVIYLVQWHITWSRTKHFYHYHTTANQIFVVRQCEHISIVLFHDVSINETYRISTNLTYRQNCHIVLLDWKMAHSFVEIIIVTIPCTKSSNLELYYANQRNVIIMYKTLGNNFVQYTTHVACILYLESIIIKITVTLMIWKTNHFGTNI